MTSFERHPVISDLPNVSLPNWSTKEAKDPQGFWYGFSESKPKGKSVKVVHKAYFDNKRLQPFPQAEHIISCQYIQVRAFCDEVPVGAARFRPYAVEDGGLKHPGVWCSSSTEVEDGWRRKGVATAIYAHMKAFSFPLSPAAVLSPDAQGMWSAFDSKLSFDSMKGEITRSSLISLPPIPNYDKESERVKRRFSEEREPDFKVFVDDNIATSCLPENDIEEASKILGTYYYSPREAFLTMLYHCRYGSDFFPVNIVDTPDEYGSNRLPKIKILRKFLPSIRNWEKRFISEFCPICVWLSEKYWAAWNAQKRKFHTDCEEYIGKIENDVWY